MLCTAALRPLAAAKSSAAFSAVPVNVSSRLWLNAAICACSVALLPSNTGVTVWTLELYSKTPMRAFPDCAKSALLADPTNARTSEKSDGAMLSEPSTTNTRSSRLHCATGPHTGDVVGSDVEAEVVGDVDSLVDSDVDGVVLGVVLALVETVLEGVVENVVTQSPHDTGHRSATIANWHPSAATASAQLLKDVAAATATSRSLHTGEVDGDVVSVVLADVLGDVDCEVLGVVLCDVEPVVLCEVDGDVD